MAADKYTLHFDVDRCFGCHGCEVACQQEHDLPKDQKWIKITQVGPKQIGDKMQMRFIPRMCMHCHAPLCLKVCPTGAIEKDTNGVVFINETKCVGCLDCTWACPFGIIQFDADKNLARKCDLCNQRIQEGLLPSCAQHCPAKAISLKKARESQSFKKNRKVLSSGLVKIIISSPSKPR